MKTKYFGVKCLKKNQSDAHQKKALIKVIINSQPVNREVDTGAAVTIVSEKTCKVKVQPTKTKLKSVTGQTMSLVDEAMVHVTCLRAKFSRLSLVITTNTIIEHT